MVKKKMLPFQKKNIHRQFRSGLVSTETWFYSLTEIRTCGYWRKRQIYGNNEVSNTEFMDLKAFHCSCIDERRSKNSMVQSSFSLASTFKEFCDSQTFNAVEIPTPAHFFFSLHIVPVRQKRIQIIFVHAPALKLKRHWFIRIFCNIRYGGIVTY